MVKGVTVRRCKPDECALVLRIWKDAGSMTSVTDTAEVLSGLIKLTNTALLVAEHQNRLAGTVIAAWDGWRGNIYRLAVLPAHRKRGIGRLLVTEAENFLVTKGAQRIGGLVAKEEPLAVSFWNAMGNDGFKLDETFVRYAKNIE